MPCTPTSASHHACWFLLTPLTTVHILRVLRLPLSSRLMCLKQRLSCKMLFCIYQRIPLYDPDTLLFVVSIGTNTVRIAIPPLLNCLRCRRIQGFINILSILDPHPVPVEGHMVYAVPVLFVKRSFAKVDPVLPVYAQPAVVYAEFTKFFIPKLPFSPKRCPKNQPGVCNFYCAFMNAITGSIKYKLPKPTVTKIKSFNLSTFAAL